MSNPRRRLQVGKDAPWPKGKRRNPVCDSAARLIRTAHDRDGFSWRDIAWLLSVSVRAARKYASGEHMPKPSVARRILRVLGNQTLRRGQAY